MCSWVKTMITNDLVCEVHTFHVQNISEKNYNLKIKIKMYLGFVEWNLFRSISKYIHNWRTTIGTMT